MRYYNRKLLPRHNTSRPIIVQMSFSLYQIIEVSEPQQYIQLNSWIIERWEDELLYWNPDDFGGLKEIILPHDSIWIPDTTLYNSLIMDDSGNRRLLDVKLTTNVSLQVAHIEMLYPTLHMFSCMLDLRFFPYDVQSCTMTFGSWTHDMLEVNFIPYNRTNNTAIDTEHCLENEGWNILSSEVQRREIKFRCCPNKYALLDFRLSIQRKPLYYLVNLIVPTSIITLIAIVGFFSSPSINNERAEKITLGITTLLSMSILIFMVSDQMPSTSSFIPLIGWFYTSMMMLISGGTLASSFVIDVQKRGFIGLRPSAHTMRWARHLGKIIRIEMPLLMKQAYILKAKQDKLIKQQQMLAALKMRYEQQQQQQLQKRKAYNFQLAKNQCKRPTLWNIVQRKNTGIGYGNTPPSSAIFNKKSDGTCSNFGAFANNAMTDSTVTTGENDSNVSNWLAPPRHGITLTPQQKISTVSLFSALQTRRTTQSHFGPPTPSLSTAENELALFSPVSEEPPTMSNATSPEEQTSIQALLHRGKDSTNSAQNKTFDDDINAEIAVSSTIISLSPLALGRTIVPTDNNVASNDKPIMLPSVPANESTSSIKRRISKKAKKKSASPATDVENGKKDSTAETPLTAADSDAVIGTTPAALLTDVDGSAAGVARNGAQRNAASDTLSASQQRNLAQIEYDWLAAVIERLFFIIFCVIFFFMSFGINMLGIYYWYFATVDKISQR